MEALNQFYEVMARHGHFMPASESESLIAAVDCFLLHYTWLTKDALKSGQECYNWVTKFHMAYHVADNSRWLNPRASWAYSYENFIGKIGDVAESLVHGTPAKQVPTKLAENYSLLLVLKLRRTVS